MTMPGRLLSRTISIATVLIVLGIGSAQSRETQPMCLAERLDTSDAVFVGKVIALVEPSPKMPGVNRYARIAVQDVLKGSPPREVSFVVSGYSAELNPDCCEVGETYLFLSKLGYDVFEVSGGAFVISTLSKDSFLSATNGRFSTFRVRNDTVDRWKPSSACNEHTSALKTDVCACIREQIEKGGPQKAN